MARATRDGFGRRITYMRLSITDRCNLCCGYCRPRAAHPLAQEEGDVLGFDELCEIAAAGVELGITRYKVTGGEPLVRRGCAELVGRLKATSGVEQVTLTTNGVALSSHLPALLDAGLDAVNVSLDTLRPQTFERITGFDCHDRVMRGIHDAVAAGLPVKVNVVLQRGLNLDEWPQLVDLSRRLPLDVRFIEAMPIGPGRDLDVVSNEWLLGELRRLHPGLAVDGAPHGNGPATYVRIPGYQGSTGFISAIHGRFCDQCNRMRLTSKGELKPCLCFGDGVDVRHVFEEHPGVGADVVALRHALLMETIRSAIAHKPRQHCFERLSEITETRAMSSIGG